MGSSPLQHPGGGGGVGGGSSRRPGRSLDVLFCPPRWIFPVLLFVLLIFVQTPPGNAIQRSYGKIGKID
jgi:hypothetical protein